MDVLPRGNECARQSDRARRPDKVKPFGPVKSIGGISALRHGSGHSPVPGIAGRPRGAIFSVDKAATVRVAGGRRRATGDCDLERQFGRSETHGHRQADQEPDRMGRAPPRRNDPCHRQGRPHDARARRNGRTAGGQPDRPRRRPPGDPPAGSTTSAHSAPTRSRWRSSIRSPGSCSPSRHPRTTCFR